MFARCLPTQDLDRRGEMETSLHRQLKAHYADSEDQTEVRLGRFRIDVVRGEELIEIQHGSLAAIRRKIQVLLQDHHVRLVKPIVLRKRLVKRAGRGRRVVDRRMSPKRGSLLELFQDLVHFGRVFPHPNLILEVPLVTIEEWRFPGHGRRRRRRERDHQVEDQKLLQIAAIRRFRTARDLAAVLPPELPRPFQTDQLARSLDIAPWFARQIAYSLRESGAIQSVGKNGNWLLYEVPDEHAHPLVDRSLWRLPPDGLLLRPSGSSGCVMDCHNKRGATQPE